jgi:RimJ/RimL family protein N-acetyltransferase
MIEKPLFPRGDWIQLAIADSAGDQLLGDIGIFLSEDGRSGEIGFTLAPSAQGRGIATEAVRAALHLFFHLTSASRVLGITDARNAPSLRLLQRVGFRLTATRTVVFRGEECVEEVYEIHRAR